MIARIIHGFRKNYDTVSIDGRARRSEDKNANSFNARGHEDVCGGAEETTCPTLFELA
jgi:hypothetical protein